MVSTGKGVVELRKAAQYQDSARTKMCCIILVILIIVAVVIGALVLGSKISPSSLPLLYLPLLFSLKESTSASNSPWLLDFVSVDIAMGGEQWGKKPFSPDSVNALLNDCINRLSYGEYTRRRRRRIGHWKNTKYNVCVCLIHPSLLYLLAFVLCCFNLP